MYRVLATALALMALAAPAMAGKPQSLGGGIDTAASASKTQSRGSDTGIGNADIQRDPGSNPRFGTGTASHNGKDGKTLPH